MIEYLETGKRVLEIEISALNKLKDNLGIDFIEVCNLMAKTEGRLIVTGVGKSGHVARKIAATLSSTGTPAFFLHATEGIHGDLGVINKNDTVIMISNSGSSQEILALLPSIKYIGAQTISITSKPDSELAKATDIHLDLGQFEEAGHLKLAPTTSTTLTLALGDAIAVALSKSKGFKETDYAVFHPGGMLGKKLLLKVKDIMFPASKNLIALPNDNLKDVLLKMVSAPIGGIMVCDNSNKLLGIITDGDIKRIATESNKDFLSHQVKTIMTSKPVTIGPDDLAVDALNVMESRKKEIALLPVVRKNNELVGALRLHDILKQGLKGS